MDRAINDSVFEALFRQAVIDNFLEELDSLPPEEELAKLYTFSPEHETRMQRLFAREARRERTRAVIMWTRRAAAVFVIAVTIIFGVLMFNPQVRAAVVETVTEWYEKFVRFTSNAPEMAKTNLEPGYIPDGFVEIVRDSDDIMTTIIYDGESDTIVFQSFRSSGSLSVDNENNNYEIRKIDGIEYHVFTTSLDNGENSIVWDIDGQRYAIFSIISIDELLAIAISIEGK